jgi:hypothetical protein
MVLLREPGHCLNTNSRKKQQFRAIRRKLFSKRDASLEIHS